MRITAHQEQRPFTAPRNQRKIETTTTYTLDLTQGVTLEHLAGVLAGLRAQHVPKAAQIEFSWFGRKATIHSTEIVDDPFGDFRISYPANSDDDGGSL